MEKVPKPIMFISKLDDGTVISDEELAVGLPAAFSVGNGVYVPSLDLELSHLQELSNSTTGLRLDVHLTDAMATNMSAVALPVSLKVKLGTQLGPPSAVVIAVTLLSD